MYSLLAIALAAQVVSANPIIGRQVTTSAAHSRNATAAPTSLLHSSTVVISDSETSIFPTSTTVQFPTSATPTPTSRGGSHGSYLYCYFPSAQNASTGIYTTLEPTFTDTFLLPEPTESTTGAFTDTFTDTFIETDTETSTDTGVISTVTATAIATTDIETETDTFSAPEPTATSDPTDTDTATATSIDFPVTTAPSPTGGWGATTYTIVGPASATQVVECIRVPRGGHPRHSSFIPTSTAVPAWTSSVPIATSTTVLTVTNH
ncbi:hypothetical protein FRC08_012306 [Ceratobasidium sp. 394]|nr:hypothetical protein FRC08_012306 [Ceratobasidium sp. 394]